MPPNKSIKKSLVLAMHTTWSPRGPHPDRVVGYGRHGHTPRSLSAPRFTPKPRSLNIEGRRCWSEYKGGKTLTHPRSVVHSHLDEPAFDQVEKWPVNHSKFFLLPLPLLAVSVPTAALMQQLCSSFPFTRCSGIGVLVLLLLCGAPPPCSSSFLIPSCQGTEYGMLWYLIQWRHPATPLQRYRFHSRSLYSLPEFLRREAVSLADAVEICATPGGRSSRPKNEIIESMTKDLETECTCSVCLEFFATGARAPLLLPTCGHTFCRACLTKLQSTIPWHCPLCGCAYTSKSASELPVNYLALGVASALEKCLKEKSQGESKGSTDQTPSSLNGTKDKLYSVINRSESPERLQFSSIFKYDVSFEEHRLKEQTKRCVVNNSLSPFTSPNTGLYSVFADGDTSGPSSSSASASALPRFRSGETKSATNSTFKTNPVKDEVSAARPESSVSKNTFDPQSLSKVDTSGTGSSAASGSTLSLFISGEKSATNSVFPFGSVKDEVTAKAESSVSKNIFKPQSLSKVDTSITGLSSAFASSLSPFIFVERKSATDSTFPARSVKNKVTAKAESSVSKNMFEQLSLSNGKKSGTASSPASGSALSLFTTGETKSAVNSTFPTNSVKGEVSAARPESSLSKNTFEPQALSKVDTSGTGSSSASGSTLSLFISGEKKSATNSAFPACSMKEVTAKTLSRTGLSSASASCLSPFIFGERKSTDSTFPACSVKDEVTAKAESSVSKNLFEPQSLSKADTSITGPSSASTSGLSPFTFGDSKSATCSMFPACSVKNKVTARPESSVSKNMFEQLSLSNGNKSGIGSSSASGSGLSLFTTGERTSATDSTFPTNYVKDEVSAAKTESSYIKNTFEPQSISKVDTSTRDPSFTSASGLSPFTFGERKSATNSVFPACSVKDEVTAKALSKVDKSGTGPSSASASSLSPFTFRERKSATDSSFPSCSVKDEVTGKTESSVSKNIFEPPSLFKLDMSGTGPSSASTSGLSPFTFGERKSTADSISPACSVKDEVTAKAESSVSKNIFEPPSLFKLDMSGTGPSSASASGLLPFTFGERKSAADSISPACSVKDEVTAKAESSVSQNMFEQLSLSNGNKSGIGSSSASGNARSLFTTGERKSTTDSTFPTNSVKDEVSAAKTESSFIKNTFEPQSVCKVDTSTTDPSSVSGSSLSPFTFRERKSSTDSMSPACSVKDEVTAKAESSVSKNKFEELPLSKVDTSGTGSSSASGNALSLFRFRERKSATDSTFPTNSVKDKVSAAKTESSFIKNTFEPQSISKVDTSKTGPSFESASGLSPFTFGERKSATNSVFPACSVKDEVTTKDPSKVDMSGTDPSSASASSLSPFTFRERTSATDSTFPSCSVKVEVTAKAESSVSKNIFEQLSLSNGNKSGIGSSSASGNARSLFTTGERKSTTDSTFPTNSVKDEVSAVRTESFLCICQRPITIHISVKDEVTTKGLSKVDMSGTDPSSASASGLSPFTFGERKSATDSTFPTSKSSF
ncbi:serine-rich adhesin for platelets [Penaeus vannamei]|uniref:serine-rich adhesin for platelets n=1 Tax=Penaeus vannamei TaxID=6689 RepID=UPI00387FA6C1